MSTTLLSRNLTAIASDARLARRAPDTSHRARHAAAAVWLAAAACWSYFLSICITPSGYKALPSLVACWQRASHACSGGSRVDSACRRFALPVRRPAQTT